MTNPCSALTSLLQPLKKPEFWLFMGRNDIHYKYKRTLLGPFWVTLTNGAYIAMLALVFGALFKVSDPIYVSWVAIGVIFWNFIGATIRESSAVFYEKKGFLLQTGEFNAAQLLYWVLWRNIITLAHQLPIILITLIGFHNLPYSMSALMVVPGFVLICATMLPYAMILALLTARLRDLEPLINTALMALFFVTPIMWQVEQLGERAWLAQLNPATHLIALVRDPLLGLPIDVSTYQISLLLAALGWTLAAIFYGKFGRRLVFWV